MLEDACSHLCSNRIVITAGAKNKMKRINKEMKMGKSVLILSFDTKTLRTLDRYMIKIAMKLLNKTITRSLSNTGNDENGIPTRYSGPELI
jgi:hypothetical protein